MLDDSVLHVAIGDEQLGPFHVEASARQAVWRPLRAVSLPVRPSAIGVGGTGNEVAIEMGGASLTVSWWMSPPAGWDDLANVFKSLAALVPGEVRNRYDFGRGGE